MSTIYEVRKRIEEIVPQPFKGENDVRDSYRQRVIDALCDGACIVRNSSKRSTETWWSDGSGEHLRHNATHSAILLGVEPIIKETAEDVLRELLKTPGTFADAFGEKVLARARHSIEAKL